MISSVSWQARGLTRQEVSLPLKMWSRQAWLQAMQVLISSALLARPCSRNRRRPGRGAPSTPCRRSREASTSSATSGVLMRLVVISGILTSPLSRLRHPGEGGARHHRRDGRNARLVPADAGIDDRRPRRLDAPWPVATTSSQVLPPSTRSSIDRRKMMMKFGPTLARVRAHRSRRRSGCGSRNCRPTRRSRWLVCGAMNWLIR